MIKSKRPKLELLGKSFIRKIVDEAFLLLEKQGVFVENEAALALLREAGMQIDETARRVKITRSLIEDSLSSAPSTIKLYDRTGEKEFVVGGDMVHFDPGSAAVTILDHATQAERKAVTEDLIKFCRLTDLLTHFHFQSTGLISSDVPEEIADVYRLYICLQYSSKPVVTGTFRVEGFKPMLDMLVAIRRSEASLAEKPLAIFDACPSPPLKWSNLHSPEPGKAGHRQRDLRAGLPADRGHLAARRAAGARGFRFAREGDAVPDSPPHPEMVSPRAHASCGHRPRDLRCLGSIGQEDNGRSRSRGSGTTAAGQSSGAS